MTSKIVDPKVDILGKKDGIYKFTLSNNKIAIKTNKSFYLGDIKSNTEYKNIGSKNSKSFKLSDLGGCLFFYDLDSHIIEYINLKDDITRKLNLSVNEKVINISHYELSGNTLVISKDINKIHNIFKINNI